MKKFVLVCLIVLFPLVAVAADSVTYTAHGKSDVGVKEYKWVALSDDGDGAISGGQSDPIYGYIIEFKVVPNSSNPPDSSYNLELRDENNFDWLFDECSALDGTDATNSANVDVPVTDSGGYPYLHGERLTVYASGMGGSGSDGFTLYLRVKEFTK